MKAIKLAVLVAVVAIIGCGPNSTFQKGKSAFDGGKYEEAQKSLAEVVKVKDFDKAYDAYLMLGEIEVKLNNPGAALSYYNAAYAKAADDAAKKNISSMYAGIVITQAVGMAINGNHKAAEELLTKMPSDILSSIDDKTKAGLQQTKDKIAKDAKFIGEFNKIKESKEKDAAKLKKYAKLLKGNSACLSFSKADEFVKGLTKKPEVKK